MKIYVDLPDEATAVWCPVGAIHIRDDVYQIVETNKDPEDTRWAFETGSKVRCKHQTTQDGQQILGAYQKASS